MVNLIRQRQKTIKKKQKEDLKKEKQKNKILFKKIINGYIKGDKYFIVNDLNYLDKIIKFLNTHKIKYSTKTVNLVFGSVTQIDYID